LPSAGAQARTGGRRRKDSGMGTDLRVRVKNIDVRCALRPSGGMTEVHTPYENRATAS
jgi:hypothetical protein